MYTSLPHYILTQFTVSGTATIYSSDKDFIVLFLNMDFCKVGHGIPDSEDLFVP